MTATNTGAARSGLNVREKVFWMTRTAMFIALLVVLQTVSASAGQMVTGSLVNLTLITGVLFCGLSSGLTLAALSPIVAKLIGIGPLWEIIPFIMIGNMALALLWHLIGVRLAKGRIGWQAVALFSAAAAKFLILFVSVAQFAVPFLLNLPDQQATMITTMFSVPQLITALIGGAVAWIIHTASGKAIGHMKNG